jgi:DNA-binding FrmR family transcriptional regulator
MKARRTHQSHPKILARLKRADGHLRSVIAMVEAERPCVILAQQLHAVEKAINQAKKSLIKDHLDHCLDDAAAQLPRHGRESMAEFKEITKYL